MNAKNVLINGESLNTILRYYYLIPILIDEVKKSGGSFYKWDDKRGKEIEAEALDVTIEINDIIK